MRKLKLWIKPGFQSDPQLGEIDLTFEVGAVVEFALGTLIAVTGLALFRYGLGVHSYPLASFASAGAMLIGSSLCFVSLVYVAFSAVMFGSGLTRGALVGGLTYFLLSGWVVHFLDQIVKAVLATGG